MKIIGYARTTINDVDLTTQVEQLSTFGCQEIFHETYEAKDAETMIKLQSVIEQMQQGDTLVICQLHRLGKSTRQLTEFTKLFNDRGLHLVSIAEEIDTRKPMGKVYFQLMEGLATMECSLIKERTLIGLNEARKKGKIGGRPKIDAKTIKKIRRLYYEKKETIQFISSKCGVSVGTCYKYINLPEKDIEQLYN
ncbi:MULTISPECIES: recombinase family protein [Enterococcus]|uniref:Resolvase n=2 Tax=root TaxID=1 RepID=A0A179ERY1_ENTTH|nr:MULTISPECIES: recombinase family protein [Enterococcus]ASZ06439.1 resolvase [Enterococcus thailandicus]MDA3964750.1 recombinase family protein [Enterococcus thailandicus]MDA3974268.1 recombinase family protein [Enterococcus thailandicus]MDA3976571.1 recombinase family protein [Enterococcus thailandicus]MDA3981721.1 recombinase family protein [Enterococcus thailandicus]